ncbi:hypothetical protein IC582_010403 [Cucumis melo]
MDVKSAFLNGYLNEEVYVAQPKDFVDSKHPKHVYKLNKALYGLKQAPRAWYERLTVYSRGKGYSRGEIDKTLFIHTKSDQILVARIYVDDIIFGGFPQDLVNNFINIMQSEFEMCMRTPTATHVKLKRDADGAEVDHKLYRSIVGSLLYLTASRPDIAYVVGRCARYQADPRISHLEAIKRILKYVHGTSDFGMMYSYNTTPTLVGYCDADWASSADNCKSTSEGCFFLGNNLIYWLSKKQNCVSLSTAKAEYMAIGSGCTQLIWLKNILHEYGFDQDTITLYCDNMSAIDISKNPVQHSRTKHINIRRHFIRELVEDKAIRLDHIRTNLQLADIFTKPLDANSFEYLRAGLGVCRT